MIRPLFQWSWLYFFVFPRRGPRPALRGREDTLNAAFVGCRVRTKLTTDWTGSWPATVIVERVRLGSEGSSSAGLSSLNARVLRDAVADIEIVLMQPFVFLLPSSAMLHLGARHWMEISAWCKYLPECVGWRATSEITAGAMPGKPAYKMLPRNSSPLQA